MSGIAFLFTILLSLILIGILVPSVPYIGIIGTIFETFASVDLLIACIIIGIVSYLSVRLGGKRVAYIALILSIANFIGYTVPIIELLNTAKEHDLNISLLQNINAKVSMGKPDLAKSVKYATINGKDLYMDISLPENIEGKNNLTPIVYIHGGGFVSGERNQAPQWTKFFNDRGYVVFDVDYRLATDSYHTWDKASADIATAIVWIGQNAEKYKVDMNKLLISGNSAGGGLALQTAYGIGDGTLKAYEPGVLVQPKAVIALYPAQDLENCWNSNNALTRMSHNFDTKYFGGSPQDYPKEYAAILPANHINKNTPPTLILAGKNDHLVPYSGQVGLANALTKANIPNEIVGLPFTEHEFDASLNGLATQISFQAVTKFLDKYAK